MINMKNAERIAFVAIKECVRQEVGFRSLVDLLSAYEVAHFWQGTPLTHVQVWRLGNLIEPTLNSNHRYRDTSVTFLHGGSAVSWVEVPDAMNRLLGVSTEGFNSDDCYQWTRQFLSIHPLRDGNGRCAWILYNMLRGTMDYPLPLPEFQF